MTDPFKALRENYGTAPDTSTIKGLKLYLELWLEKDEIAPSRGLKQGCASMIKTLHGAILATEQDLKKTGQTDESLADPVERTIEAYERLSEVMEDLISSVDEENRERAVELSEELDEAADYLSEAQDDLDAWVQEPILRCPRCGSNENDPCSTCGLELLVLDPQGGSKASDSSAALPQEFGRVFEAYTAVRNGEKTLGELVTVLPLVEKNLGGYMTVVNASLVERPESQTLLETRETLTQLRGGIQKMRNTQQTRLMTDLQDGWLQVFRNGVRLQELRLNLMEELGGEVGRAQAAQERSLTTQQDSVSISGD